MSPAREAQRAGNPGIARATWVDTVVAAYAIVSAAALAFPHRPPTWPAILLAHAGLFALALTVRAIRSRELHPAVRFVVEWYPLLAIPFLYAELDSLNQAVHAGAFFDAAVQTIERRVFGLQPSFAWARAMPWLPLSEPLHAAYLAYYPLIYLPPIALYFGGRRREFSVMVGALVLTFVAHYVFFIYLPVQGPRYIFDAPTGGIERGPVYRLAHAILESGSSRGAAFPSSHVGVAIAQAILISRFMPRLALPAFALAIALACGAVYGGFHYAIDAIAGGLLGTTTTLLVLRASRPARS